MSVKGGRVQDHFKKDSKKLNRKNLYRANMGFMRQKKKQRGHTVKPIVPSFQSTSPIMPLKQNLQMISPQAMGLNNSFQEPIQHNFSMFP